MLAIVRIFPAAKKFPAVYYNTHKVAHHDAELLMSRNFGILHTFSKISSLDYENYLFALSSLNHHTDYDQFHAVISVKKDAMTAMALQKLGEAWLKKMGYQKQPYLIFFHRDNANNHIHLVSCNVRIDGSRIDTAFIRIRAMRELHVLIGVDRKADFKRDITPLLSYSFSDLNQLCILLALKGYRGKLKDEKFRISKYGSVMLEMDAAEFSKLVLSPEANQANIQSLRGKINEEMLLSSNACKPVYQPSPKNYKTHIISFYSELSDNLKNKWNIEICYHFDKHTITGFTAIAHQSRIVLEGDQIMDLSRLISRSQSQAEQSLLRSR